MQDQEYLDGDPRLVCRDCGQLVRDFWQKPASWPTTPADNDLFATLCKRIQQLEQENVILREMAATLIEFKPLVLQDPEARKKIAKMLAVMGIIT